jgi:hypothetical protein
MIHTLDEAVALRSANIEIAMDKSGLAHKALNDGDYKAAHEAFAAASQATLLEGTE